MNPRGTSIRNKWVKTFVTEKALTDITEFHLKINNKGNDLSAKS